MKYVLMANRDIQIGVSILLLCVLYFVGLYALVTYDSYLIFHGI